MIQELSWEFSDSDGWLRSFVRKFEKERGQIINDMVSKGILHSGATVAKLTEQAVDGIEQMKDKWIGLARRKEKFEILAGDSRKDFKKE